MSSKKPFDYIEDKIKQAAENNLPPFDEKAWEAMNAKLDKEEKRRKPFFLWWIVLPLLLIGGLGAYQLLNHPNNDGQKLVSITTTTDKQQPKPIAEQLPVADGNDKTGSTDSEQKSTASIDDKISAVKNKGTVTATVTKTPTLATDETVTAAAEKRGMVVKRKKGKLAVSNTAAIAEEDQSATNNDKITAIDNQFNRRITTVKRQAKASVTRAANAADEVEDETANANNVQSPTVVKKKNNAAEDPFAAIKSAPQVAVVQQKESESSGSNDVKKKENAAENGKTKTTDQQKDKAKNVSEKGFYLLATAGPDAGSVKLFSYDNSSVTPKFGIGAGYQFNNRLSVQTGFYAVNKKYIALKGDYHAKPGSYWDRVEIEKVKAACLIYEIPITVRYNLVRRKSLNFYATAGMSSYIMQKENYDYYYNAYNTYHEKEVQYTGNKNFFSTLSFSIGVEKKLTPAFSLLLEPSVSVPVTGVGEGKVNLYSSALQLGARYFFSKKKK